MYVHLLVRLHREVRDVLIACWLLYYHDRHSHIYRRR